MRPDPARSPRGDEVPPALRGTAVRRAVLAPVTAAMLAFVPVIVLASPAYAAAGDVTITPTNLEVTEDDTLTFDLKREGGSGSPLVLDYAITGTATAGVDFTTIGGQTTFAASGNDIVKRFSIRGIADALDEADETVILTFTDPNNNDAVVATGNGVLVDDDPTPNYTLTASPNPISEGAGSVTVTATLTAVSGRDVTIPLSTTAGTALAGQDYTARTNENLVIPAGNPSGTITVPILDDSLDEDDTQQFTVGAGTDPDTNVGTGNTVTVTVQDNDDLPTINITNPGNAVEGSPVTFEATLSAASERTVTVTANTANGTATAGQDYTAVAAHTVTFAPGDVSEDIVVSTDTDLLDEVNPETLTMTLSNPSNTATLGTGSPATGGITDDDNPPTISLTPGSVNEGDSNTATQTFTVELDAPSGRTVEVGYSTSAGTATEGVDYDDVTAGTLTFAPGETTKTFDVAVHGDTMDEGAGETFNIVLSNPNNTLGASAALGTTQVTITDDDAKPTLNPMADVTRAEGSGDAEFTLSLSNASSEVITVDVAANDGTAEVAGSGAGSNDYDAPAASVTFLPGETSKTITVNVNGDEVYEDTETADVVVTIPGGETDLDGSGVDATLTLTNDDAAPSIELSTATVAEGGNIAVTGTVTGVAQDAYPVTITLAGAATGGGVAADVADFVNAGPVNVNIPAGDNTGVQVPLHTFAAQGDTIDEATQQVRVTLTHPDTSTVTAYQNITDDPADLPPTVSLSDVSVAEDAGNAVVDVDLTFDADTNDATSTEVPVVVPYSTADGTASAGADFTAPAQNASVTFAPGDVAETISIPILDDSAYELDETFTVNAGSVTPSGAVVTDGSATVTVQGNDLGARPTFSVDNVTKAENDGTPAAFTVTLSGPSSQDVTFAAEVVDGTAEDDESGAGRNDFNQPSTTVTIPAGQTTATVNVPIVNDTVYESTETASLEVSLAQNEDDATGPLDTSTLTITDADAAPSLTLTPESSAEGTNVAVIATVSGVAQAAQDVSVSIAGASVAGSDAAEVADFVNAGPVTVTIPAGDSTGTPLEVREFRFNNDTVDENVETVVATVTDSDNVVPTTTGVYRINDDANDTPPSLSIGNATVTESTTPANLTVSLTFDGETTATERPVVVDYTTVNGSALAGTDYTAVAPGQLTIAAGQTSGQISIPIIPNDNDGPDRTFGVTLTSATPTGTQLADAEGSVTITDDDADVPRPGFSVEDNSVEENDGPGTLTVTLDHATVNDVSFTIGAADAGAADAGSGAGSNDYNAPSTTLTIPAGQSSGTVSVPVNNDAVFEDDEDVTVTVSLAQGETDATGSTDTSTLTILNDDNAPSITLNTQSGTEGTDLSVIATVTGQAQANTVFDVTLTGDDSGTNNAAEGVDYDDNGLQAVIPGGTTSGAKVLLRTIRLEQDTVDEPVEAIGVLVQDSAGDVADATSIYKINDDVSDVPPSVALVDATAAEGDGAAIVGVELTFDGETTETERDIVVNYKTTNGTATAGSDYTAVTAGQLTIEAGETLGEIAVPVTDDSADENDQTFTVSTVSVVPGETQVTDSSAVVTIEDNDEAQAPTLTAPTERTGSGNVTLSGTAGQGATVLLYAAPVGVSTLVNVASTTANSNGAYSFTRVLSTRGYQFQTRVGDAESPVRTILMRHEPLLTASSTRSGTVTLTVRNDPKVAGLPVVIQRLNPNGSWTTVATGTTVAGGTFTRNLTGLRRGTAMTHRAYVGGNADLGYVGGFSTAFRVTVR